MTKASFNKNMFNFTRFVLDKTVVEEEAPAAIHQI